MAEEEDAESSVYPKLMAPELKAKWIAALRSGEYRQGRHALRKADGSYCCLGVLCEVAGVKLDVAGEFPEGAADYGPITALGICNSRQTILIGMNDGFLPKPFSEIAKWIERNV